MHGWTPFRRPSCARSCDDSTAGTPRGARPPPATRSCSPTSQGVRTPAVRPGNEDVWHLYVIRVDERDRVLAELGAAGIGVGIHYPTPVHLTEAYASLGYRRGQFPVAEAAADRILSLPMFPHLAEEQQERVVAALEGATVRDARAKV